jgi:hypothetical protein
VIAFGAVALTVAGAVAIAGWGLPGLRRLAWVGVGVLGLPAILLSMLYLVGFVIVPLLIAVGYAVGRSQVAWRVT